MVLNSIKKTISKSIKSVLSASKSLKNATPSATPPPPPLTLQVPEHDKFFYIKYIISTILYVIFFIVLLLFPNLEIICLATIFGIQIFNTLFLFKDIYNVDIKGDRISAFVIIVSLIAVFIAMSIVVNSIIRFNEIYQTQGKRLYLLGEHRYGLNVYEIIFKIEYFIILILAVLYFKNTPIRIDAIQRGEYKSRDFFGLYLKIILGFLSLILSAVLVYYALGFSFHVVLPNVTANTSTSTL